MSPLLVRRGAISSNFRIYELFRAAFTAYTSLVEPQFYRWALKNFLSQHHCLRVCASMLSKALECLKSAAQLAGLDPAECFRLREWSSPLIVSKVSEYL